MWRLALILQSRQVQFQNGFLTLFSSRSRWRHHLFRRLRRGQTGWIQRIRCLFRDVTYVLIHGILAFQIV